MASAVPANMPGIVRDSEGGMYFTDWNCRAGQSDVIIRTDGTVAPCFPMYSSSFDWGNIETPKFDAQQLQQMKGTCQRHCFSTLNHNWVTATTMRASSSGSGDKRFQPSRGGAQF